MERLRFEPSEAVIRIHLTETEKRILQDSLEQSINRARSHIRRSQMAGTDQHKRRSASKITRHSATIVQMENLLERIETKFNIANN